jgi:hypothetical protein
VKREVLEYARGRVNLLRRAGRPVSKNYARELVDDAHADTWSGALAWDPSQRPLVHHLRLAIRKRTWLEIRHGRRFSLVPLLEPENDEESASPEQIVSEEVEQALAKSSQSKCDPTMLHAMLAEICRELRLRLAQDDEAAFIVQCWEEGSVERSVVMALTGLTETAYDRTRKRLFYAIRQLSPELCRIAQDVLRNAS